MPETTESFASQVVLAEKAAQKAVETVLTHFGFDAKDPVKVQTELASIRRLAKTLDDEDFASDMAFIRRLRLTTEKASGATITTIANILVTGIVGLLVLGTKDWWLKHIIG